MATTPPIEPVFVSVDDAGIRTSLCSRTIRRAIAAGELPGYKFGKALRVRLDDLDKWTGSKLVPTTLSAGRRQ